MTSELKIDTGGGNVLNCAQVVEDVVMKYGDEIDAVCWQRIRQRLTPDRERVADKKRMFHCDTHGEWDTMRASGCPDCIAESRRLLRDASTPRWSDEGEPENLMAAAMDALEWLRYLRDLPAGLPLGSANSERMADAVSAIERFVPPNAAIDAMKETP